MATFTGIGCMSGSSLDGLDLCYVEFTGDLDTDVWGYRIIKAKTILYNPEWERKLRYASTLTSEEFVKLHIDYGHLIGKEIKQFIQSENILSVDFVASHGHTIFHNPGQSYTFQLGDGETTSVYLECPFVCNFRNKDLALGGQGAPFVPCGEKYLFSSNDICINLGGIANIGLRGYTGYDVSPCNFVSNRLASMHDPDLKYDVDGKIASDGTVIPSISEALEALSYYRMSPPKSLSTEWIENQILPILNRDEHSVPNLMRTYIEHVSTRLSEACLYSKNELNRVHKEPFNILVTGGGAFNKALMDCFISKISDKCFHVIETDSDTICFKEALIFAFLGLRCLLGEENVFQDVTGSTSDSVSGSIHLPSASHNTPGKLLRTNFELKRRRGRISCSFNLE